MQHTKDIIVIGAGVIGISTALELQRRGRRVCVIDPLGVGQGASRGNAGAFAFSDILPLATPRVMRKAPRWLIDPLGPLSIPPSYALKIAPWLWKFWRASRPAQFTKAVATQAQFMTLAQAAHERQVKRVNGAHLMRHQGQLQLYDSHRSFKASLPEWDLRKHHGIAFEKIHKAGTLQDIQPGLSASFRHAVFTPNWMNTVNPKTWVDHLANAFRQAGGTISAAKANRIETQARGAIVHTEQGALHARQLVIAAGAHSHLLARDLGEFVPLETERGYNTTLKACSFELRTQLTFADHGFVVTKLDAGLRVGGSVELGGLKAPPNYDRARHLLNKASAFLPGLDITEGEQWMGLRPSMPDSLPVIDHARNARDVIYAFGHGHLGLTQAAATAEIVADLAEDRTPAIPLDALSARRF